MSYILRSSRVLNSNRPSDLRLPDFKITCSNTPWIALHSIQSGNTLLTLFRASIINVSQISIALFSNFQNEKALKIRTKKNCLKITTPGSYFNRFNENQQSFLVFKTYIQHTFRHHLKQSPKYSVRHLSWAGIIWHVIAIYSRSNIHNSSFTLLAMQLIERLAGKLCWDNLMRYWVRQA